jgi:peptidoglycan hydrolase-like protein with peptidoglycan-binding domain
MSRSMWAAAGASALAFALTPGVAMAAAGGSSAARSPGVHAERDDHPTRRSTAPARRADAPAGARRRAPVLLGPGAGYDQRLGSSSVRALQRRLARLGLAPGPIDGLYGPLTSRAVERFQAAVGLTVDAVVGPRTSRALRATPSDAVLPGAGYQQPEGNRRVRALQRRLARLGFAAGPVDGRDGPLTTRAVERFQHSRGLAMDGIVAAHTLIALSAAGQVGPISAERRQRHLARQRRPGSPPGSAGARPRRTRIPALPLTPVLLAFAVLGVMVMALSYARTRSRISQARAAGRRTRGPAAEFFSAVTPEPLATRDRHGHRDYRERDG